MHFLKEKIVSSGLIWLLFSCLHLQAQELQVIKALPGDNISVTVENQSENIQWQSSLNGNDWSELNGETQSILSYEISLLPIFLRAQINKPNCDLAYSGLVRVEKLLVIPEVSTNAASNISATSFLSGGAVVNDGGDSISDKGLVYSTAETPTLANSKISKGKGSGSFSAFITSLEPETTYFIRAYAVNAIGVGYGQQISLKTLEAPKNVLPPTLATSAITNITATSASVEGNISNDGGAPVTGRGIVYSTSTMPTLNNSVVSSGQGTGAFTVALTNINPNTQYYVRAFATNSAGTFYGNEQVFTTLQLATLPVLSETTYSGLTKNSVTLSSSVSASGTLSSKGFVISTSVNSTIDNALIVPGSGDNTFNGSTATLASGVVYYARAYATNEAGTAYGQEISFRTNDSNVILMFVPHQQTYYSEYIVMRKALEASGFVVEVRSATEGAASLYMSSDNTSISATSATLAGGSHLQFTQQFLHLFGTPWDESLDNYPATINVTGRIQDVVDMGPYRAMVVVGGLGALAYRVDGVYASQASASAPDVEAAALKLNALALNALSTGKPVMAQCHAASLPVFWRIPGTSGPGVENLGFSLLKGQHATGFPEPETGPTLQSFGVTLRATNITDGDRITISSPHTSFEDNGLGDYKIITTRDWYPQTVAHAARTLLNMLGTYPTKTQMTNSKSVLVLHGGAVNSANCSAANRANDIPCNYGAGQADLPADYTDLQNLLSDSPNDEYNFSVTQLNLANGTLPVGQQDLNHYLDDFDVIVFYKHWSTGLTNTLLNAIVTFADNGGGVLALHHGLYNDLEGSQNKDILVNQLFGASSAPWASLAEGNRTTYRLFSTNYGHFISTFGINLIPANLSLPAPAPWSSNNLSAKANASFSYYHNFQLFDELYNNMVFNPGAVFGRNVNEITPIFSNDQNPATQSHVSGFIKLFNQTGSDIGRVAYFQPGERKENYNQSHPYGQVIRNAIVWLSNK